MTKILAAIDDSAYAASVCDHAAWFAERAGFAIELVHVINRVSNQDADHDLSGSIGIDARSNLLDELSELDKQMAKVGKERGRALLQNGKQRIQELGIEDVTTTLRHDRLSDTVTELENQASVIVIGKRGKSANFASKHVGSNLERVARSSRVPLFVASRAFKPIKKALVAYDGGSSSNRAIDELVNNPGFKDVDLELLFVGSTSESMGNMINKACSRLTEAGYNIHSSTTGGTVEKVIAEHVVNNDIDMLLMGAYGHSRIRHLLIGSTTTEMLRTCLVPVMLFR